MSSVLFKNVIYIMCLEIISNIYVLQEFGSKYTYNG